jgi:D-glycerate 3-kinase
VFSSLRGNRPTKIPQYNKAAFNGQGDRVPSSEWEEVNTGDEKIKVLLYEGWCVGFRPLDDEKLQEKWQNAVAQKETGQYTGRLGYNKLEDVATVNDALRRYDKLTECDHPGLLFQPIR